jgi:hypothetical protein
MKGPILDHLGPERTGLVLDTVQAAVTQMQENVLSMVA